jgi:hypothetical protein
MLSVSRGRDLSTDEQWEKCVEGLTLYAARKFIRLGWHGRGRNFDRAGPGGVTPDDMASSAITSVIDGTRNYDSGSQPEFMRFLESIVDSQVSHLAESATARKTRPIPLASGKGKEGKGGDAKEVEFPGRSPDPLEVCLNADMVAKAKAVVIADTGKDSDTLKIFECLEAGIYKPSEMAEVLGMDIARINNTQKRLRRKIEQAFMAGDKEGRS